MRVVEASNFAISRFWRYVRCMAKLDPIISEFDTDEDAEAYDKWFRAQVEAGLEETGGVPHEEVMRKAQAIIDKYLNARSDLAA